MLDKISKWDEESDAIWLSSNNNALQKTLADNRAIMNNLRQICTAAQMFFLESGEPIAKYSDLIGEYLSKPKPINGENYTDIIIKSDDTSVQVIDADGVLHKYQF
jgi:hypothetical protein